MTTDNTIALAVQLQIKPPFLNQFLTRILQQARDSIAQEPGCLQFDVSVDEDAPGRVFLYEIYTDSDALDAHRNTPHFADYSATTADWIESKQVQRLRTVARCT